MLCAFIYGVSQKDVTGTLNQSDGCDITDGICQTSVLGKPFSVNFEQKPEAEEELFLKFYVAPQMSIEHAWIEGINMYMGKTPVMFENQAEPDRAVTFLGSCNLQQMKWLLNVEVKNNATQEVALLQFTFSTFLE
jgi:hypothetical protein